MLRLFSSALRRVLSYARARVRRYRRPLTQIEWRAARWPGLDLSTAGMLLLLSGRSESPSDQGRFTLVFLPAPRDHFARVTSR